MPEPASRPNEGIPFFLLLFLIPCVLTYIPLAGVLGSLLLGINPILIPVALYALMALACYFRGRASNQSWLIALPLVAAAFDLLPVISWVPLVPTALNVIAIILGVRGNSGDG